MPTMSCRLSSLSKLHCAGNHVYPGRVGACTGKSFLGLHKVSNVHNSHVETVIATGVPVGQSP